MAIKLSDAIKKQVDKVLEGNSNLTKLAALSIVHAKFEDCFKDVFNEFNAAIDDGEEDWDEMSDAEYCANRFGENFEHL